jgi:metal-sulfur cluster biosynthetic enzyme
VESFYDYKLRVSKLLLNWPECIMENWLYRHYSYAVSEYGWIKFDKVTFELASWKMDRIFNDIQSHKMDCAIDGLGYQIYERQDKNCSWLQSYMYNNRTWPVPIIIMKNDKGIKSPSGEDYGQPYHLIEGHLRLGYFRTIYKREKDTLKPEHNIWIMALNENVMN